MDIPKQVLEIVSRLQQTGHEAYVVGGAVRDLLLNLEPKDWDVTTSARPEEVMRLFPRVIPTGIEFGTVTVLSDGLPVEVTTFRAEGRYNLKRRPEEVRFGVTLHEDLSRRDFEVNAIAYDPYADRLIDLYEASPMLHQGILFIRAVGRAEDRFDEDPLRMLRAVSLAARAPREVRVRWDRGTFKAILKMREKLYNVSYERINQEFTKILISDRCGVCLELMDRLKLLEIVVPELVATKGVEQRKAAHKYDVFTHTLATVAAITPRLDLRLAALLHDIGKPATMKPGPDGETHFFGHERVGAKMAASILQRLRYPKEVISKVTHLIYHHMFSYPETDAGIRRFIARVGQEHVWDLLELRRADTLGSGKRLSWRYHRFKKRLEEIMYQAPPFTVRDLAVDGYDVMRELDIKPGPRVGQVLRFLLNRVLDNPELNKRDVLLEMIRNFNFEDSRQQI